MMRPFRTIGAGAHAVHGRDARRGASPAETRTNRVMPASPQPKATLSEDELTTLTPSVHSLRSLMEPAVATGGRPCSSQKRQVRWSLLWSPVVATGGIGGKSIGADAPKQAKTVAVGCDRLPLDRMVRRGSPVSSPKRALQKRRTSAPFIRRPAPSRTCGRYGALDEPSGGKTAIEEPHPGADPTPTVARISCRPIMETAGHATHRFRSMPPLAWRKLRSWGLGPRDWRWCLVGEADHGAVDVDARGPVGGGLTGRRIHAGEQVGRWRPRLKT